MESTDVLVADFRPRVDIDAIPEGELVFAREPMVRVTGPMLSLIHI